MKTKIKNLAVFVCICSVITLLLAATNFITAPIIAENQNAAANQALMEVMPEAKGFEVTDISTFTLPATVSEVNKETSGLGYVIKLITAGYGSDMVIMCGVTSDGVVTGAVCLSSNETLGKEKTYGENFKDKDAAGVEAVDIITGATKTTEAYKNAIKDALNTVVILGGGSVDIRTEEEILADNLSAAFPDGEGSFEKMFMVEVIEGIDSVYTATNGKGFVFVVGEQFVGVDTDGTVVTEGVEDATLFTNALAVLKASITEDIDLTAYPDLAKYVISAKKTASGNFILETKGAGYGIKGGNEYHPASGEYIIVRVAVTADLQIIDCITVSEAETDGLGDACANESFYGQFAGKSEENYKEIDAISGATMTTDGYLQAIERAFTAIKTLNGGAANE
ncbi:MAG: FMN-binding protein [Ruminococcaceae bacterium]|nr:FMN-binding protein [Oscillospiraceae bacterium]